MVKKLCVCLILYLSFVLSIQAQVGGQRGFHFLELPANARVSALGGVNITSFGHDVNMAASNPALLNSETDRQLSLSYAEYLAGIKQSNLLYGFNHDKYGRWAAGLNYLNYGQFVQRDAAGMEEGTFSVNDYVFSMSHARQSEAFTLGATAKLAVSSMAGNKALGLLADIGGIFRHPEEDLTVGLVFKNVGYQVKIFDGGERSAMPFDAQLGISFKPEHMPVRLSVTAHRLYQFDVVYQDPNAKGQLDADGNEVKEKVTFGDKVARHFVIGSEFIFSKNFNLRAGYNHMRRKELRLDNAAGGAGFSIGVMLRIKTFELSYGSAFFHPSGASHYVTISTDTGALFKSFK